MFSAMVPEFTLMVPSLIKVVPAAPKLQAPLVFTSVAPALLMKYALTGTLKFVMFTAPVM